MLSLAALLLAALLNCDDGQSSPSAYKTSAECILSVFDLPGGSNAAFSNGSTAVEGETLDDMPRKARGWARTGEWQSQLRAYSEEHLFGYVDADGNMSDRPRDPQD